MMTGRELQSAFWRTTTSIVAHNPIYVRQRAPLSSRSGGADARGE